MPDKDGVIKDLRKIPGVGKSIAEDLWNMGYRSVSQLREENPRSMYDKLCMLQGTKVDMCMQYVFRCAVYYATADEHDPELLKWWNWKDRILDPYET